MGAPSLLRNKTTLQTPKCPRAWLWPTSAKHILRTSKRPKSTDTWCSTSKRRSPSRWSLWEAGRRAMTTSSTICRGAGTRSAGQCEGPVHLRTLSKIRRYGLYDFEYEHQCQGTTDSSKKQKLFLMSWCPDSAKIKKKMLYSSS